MRLRWILPLLALSTLVAVRWMLLEAERTTPAMLFESACARLDLDEPRGNDPASREAHAAWELERGRAMREIEEALRRAAARGEAELHARILRRRAALYEKQGLESLALADCRAELAEWTPLPETLARASDMSLALEEIADALTYATQLADLDPVLGKGRIGRCQVAFADAPLADARRLARGLLPSSTAENVARLAQRAAVYVDDPGVARAALEEVLEPFDRPDQRRLVREWVVQASEHMRLARQAFLDCLAVGAVRDGVAGLQDLFLRAGDERQAADLGRVALAKPDLEEPMTVLARTAEALERLGRLGTARALIEDLYARRGAVLRARELPSHALGDELADWCLLLERFGQWGPLRGAAWEFTVRSNRDPAKRELAAFLSALADLGSGALWPAQQDLDGLGLKPIDQYDIPVRAMLARAVIARRQNQASQERYALVTATRLAGLDPPAQLRPDIGRAWQRLAELQRRENDPQAVEVSLTHALACSPERAAELEPLWVEAGQKTMAGRGVTTPYALYTRARSSVARGLQGPAIVDARALLKTYPGLGPALEVLASAAFQERDFPLLIRSSLEQLERGWPPGAPSARLRQVPPGYFLPQDRVRWMEKDPRAALEGVVRRLLELGDVHGAALAARAGPARYQPVELLPLLARVECEDRAYAAALDTLALLPKDSPEFRGATGLALRASLGLRMTALRPERGDKSGLRLLDAVLSSGAPQDPEVVTALDPLLALNFRSEVDALLGWLQGGSLPALEEVLLRAAAARLLDAQPPAVDDDLERAAALLADGRPELGRLALALERDDADLVLREASAALDTPLASTRATRAALLLLSGRVEAAAELLASSTLDGRDFGLELCNAALAVLRPEAVEPAQEAAPRFGPELLAALPVQRLLVDSLCASSRPWCACVLARTLELPREIRRDPWVVGLRTMGWLTLERSDLALRELGGQAANDRALAWLRARALQAAGAEPAELRAAELDWWRRSGREPGDDPELVRLAAAQAVADGDPDGARAQLEARLDLRPEPGILVDLARLEDRDGRRTRAVELLREAIVRMPRAEGGEAVLELLGMLARARTAGEITEARWWAEVEALEAEWPEDPAPVRELVARTFETRLGAGEDDLERTLQRLTRFRERSFQRPFEELRPGETARWAQLLARSSPERAVRFAEEELQRDPVDPELWRVSAEAQLAARNWSAALARLEAVQRVAPEPRAGRLLAVTSYRVEHDPAKLAERLATLERFDEEAASDPVLSFYRALARLPLKGEAEPLARALALWDARAESALFGADMGRELGIELYLAGRRDEALRVLEEARLLAEVQLERDLFAALVELIASAKEPPRVAPEPSGSALPPSWAFDDGSLAPKGDSKASTPKAGDRKQVPRPGAAAKGAAQKGAQQKPAPEESEGGGD